MEISCEEQIYHLLAPKGGAKSVRRAKKSGNGRRLAPKTLRGRARARVFDGAAAARSSSRFSAMRSLLCASRNNDLLRFEFLSSHLAGLRPEGSHCEKSGKSDDTCASARSGCAKQRSLLCPLSERGWRHPLLFAVLDLLVLLDQDKSTEERKCTTEEIDSSGRIPTRRSAAPYLGGRSLRSMPAVAGLRGRRLRPARRKGAATPDSGRAADRTEETSAGKRRER